jgi:hypothetical protein
MFSVFGKYFMLEKRSHVFMGVVILKESRSNSVGPVGSEIYVTVKRVVWFGGRSRIDITPREESKMVETFFPPAERVIFTEALEEV